MLEFSASKRGLMGAGITSAILYINNRKQWILNTVSCGTPFSVVYFRERLIATRTCIDPWLRKLKVGN